jgi:tRNA A37 threonylcarbamoyladenosine modification protein TsaB
MYRILIDTKERYRKSAKLVKGKKAISERVGDIDIAAAIKEMLDESNLSIGDIDEFAADPGPGSFTGLKVGVTLANVLNWVLGRRSLNELTYPNYGAEPNIHKTKWLEK